MAALIPSEIRSLRNRFKLDQADFARLVGVNTRTVHRWELGDAVPTGAASAVLLAVDEKLRKDPSQADEIIAFLVSASAIGGLAYVLIRLLDEHR